MELHKEQLLALLKSLECQKIPTLLTKDPDVFRNLGEVISRYARIGAKVVVIQIDEETKEVMKDG